MTLLELFIITVTLLMIGFLAGAQAEKHIYKKALIHTLINAYASDEDIIYEDDQYSLILKIVRFKAVA